MRLPLLRHVVVNVADGIFLATVFGLWLFGVSSLAFGLIAALMEQMK